MLFLPIKSIRTEDYQELGKDIISLGKLNQFGLPVADGIVVFPQNLEKILVPEQLKKELSKRGLNAKKVWDSLLKKGFATPQPIFFTNKITASGRAFLDGEEVIIDSNKILSHEQEVEIDQLVRVANKVLFIPQIYHFIIDSRNKVESIKFVKVTEYTPQIDPDSIGADKKINSQIKRIVSLKQELPKSALKVFVEDIDSGKVDADGASFSYSPSEDLDLQILRLYNSAASLKENPVIFKLEDSSLNLIRSKDLLKKQVEIFLFSRHKKHLLNTQICIPLTRSASELMQIKRDLAALKVFRKGSLKMWLEMAVPENLINIEDYLVAGIDGVIINLEKLAAQIGGFDKSGEEAFFYEGQSSSLIKFLEDGLRVLHKSKIPVLVSGVLATNDEVLGFLIDRGVYGIIVKFSNALGIKDHLSFLEKHLIQHKNIN